MKKVRDTNLELLRVVCMVIIVLSHYVYHGGLLYEELSTNQIFAQLLKVGGKLGVICFVLISAYFLVDSKFDIRNVIRLCLQVMFYSIIMFVAKFASVGECSFVEIVKSFFAPVYGVYWFATAYIGMYFCFPLLNIIIDKLGGKLLKVLMIYTIVYGFGSFFFVGSDFLYSDLTCFLYIYLWGAYIKKHQIHLLEKNACFIVWISFLGIWVSSISLNFLGLYLDNKTIIDHSYYFSNITSPLMLTAGLGMFVIFKNLKMRTNKWINYLGSITFGVYLIHDNPFFRDIMWNNIFKVESFYSVNFFVLFGHMVIVVILLFLVSALLETVRKKGEILILNTRILKRFSNRFNNWLNFEMR